MWYGQPQWSTRCALMRRGGFRCLVGVIRELRNGNRPQQYSKAGGCRKAASDESAIRESICACAGDVRQCETSERVRSSASDVTTGPRGADRHRGGNARTSTLWVHSNATERWTAWTSLARASTTWSAPSASTAADCSLPSASVATRQCARPGRRLAASRLTPRT